MSTVTQLPPIPAPGEVLRLKGVTWDEYVSFVDELHKSRRVRTAYHGDLLEIMTISPGHDRVSRFLHSVITALSLQTGVDIVSGGSTTFRSELKKRGAEPDECYWIANASAAIGLKRWNAETDPPPDLVIEVDITSDSINRRPIYAKLGIAEMWRFDGRSLEALSLNENGEYVSIDSSLAFPVLAVADLLPFVTKLDTMSDTAILREFANWCSAQDFVRQ